MVARIPNRRSSRCHPRLVLGLPNYQNAMTQEKADKKLFARLATLHPDERRHLLKLLENGGIMECERKAVELIDCPRCGSKPPIAHALGGGPGFEGVRTCGKGCGTWDADDRTAWLRIHSENEKCAATGSERNAHE